MEIKFLMTVDICPSGGRMLYSALKTALINVVTLKVDAIRNCRLFRNNTFYALNKKLEETRLK